MLFNFAAVLVFLLWSVLFIFGSLIIGSFVRPKNPTSEKLEVYECGEPAIGSSWVRYNIRFYTIALVYLIFDVEVVFLFPAVLMIKQLHGLALLEIFTFVAILTLGLAYAWRYGTLDWVTGEGLAEAPGEEEGVLAETEQVQLSA